MGLTHLVLFGRTPGSILLRILGAAILTALIMAVACEALFFTTASPAVSLVLEPLSLLLVPGAIFSLVTDGSHDISPDLILRVSAAFYFVAFSLLLLRRPRTHKPSR